MFSRGARKLSGPEIKAHTASCFMEDEDTACREGLGCQAWGSGVSVTAKVCIPKSVTLCTHPPHGRAGGPTILEVPGGPSPGGSQGQGICSSTGLGKASYTPQFSGRGGGLESYACPQDTSQSVPGRRKRKRLSNRRAGQGPDGVRDWKASSPTQPSHSLSPGQQPEPTDSQPERGWGLTAQSQGGRARLRAPGPPVGCGQASRGHSAQLSARRCSAVINV